MTIIFDQQPISETLMTPADVEEVLHLHDIASLRNQLLLTRAAYVELLAYARAAMAAVLARTEVTAKWVLVPAACLCCGLAGQSVTPQWPDADVA